MQISYFSCSQICDLFDFTNAPKEILHLSLFLLFCNTLLTYTPPYHVSHVLNRDVIFLNGNCGHRVVTCDSNNDKHSSCQCQLVVPYTPLSHAKCQIDKPDPLAQIFKFSLNMLLMTNTTTVPFRSIRQSRVTPTMFEPGFNFFSIYLIFFYL